MKSYETWQILRAIDEFEDVATRRGPLVREAASFYNNLLWTFLPWKRARQREVLRELTISDTELDAARSKLRKLIFDTKRAAGKFGG